MTTKTVTERKPSAWNRAVQKAAKKNPSKSFVEVVQIAKKVYKKK